MSEETDSKAPKIEPESRRDDPAGKRACFSEGEPTLADPAYAAPGTSIAPPAGLRESPGDRYEFRSELGRGGLGRVVEAVDRDFGREVAVKMMLPGQPPSAVERFLLEGRVAGRLPHPNIVPIYEIGALRAGGRESPFFTMAKIRGLDLGKILRAVERGNWESAECRLSSAERRMGEAHPEHSTLNTEHPQSGAANDPRSEFTRTRLLRVFIEVCNAIAYAHAHGVIHRDLKPANVMVGEYGEVYVVDWGLAKILGQKHAPSSTLALPSKPLEPDASDQDADLHDSKQRKLLCKPSPQEPDHVNQQTDHVNQAREDQLMLTLEGTVMGTPAYMPPEQARGSITEIDRQSDIYSLGAILYEILTFEPPHVGKNADDVLSKVLRERVIPPSERVSSLRETSRKAPAGEAESAPPILPDDIPAELDAICTRALARNKSDRFAAVKDLIAALEDYLDREKEKAKNLKLSADRLGTGLVRLREADKLRAEADTLKARVEEEHVRVGHRWPVELKKPLWDMEARVEALEDAFSQARALARTDLQAALEFDRSNREARAALADMFWTEFQRHEEAGNRQEGILAESLVRLYNDGQYDELLRGEGTLSIETLRYACPCLREPRTVAGPSLDAAGFHPMSGRSHAGYPDAEGVPAFEPRGEISLRLHSPECVPEPLPGADAWLFRHEEKDRLFVPVYPEGVLLPGQGAGGTEHMSPETGGIQKEGSRRGLGYEDRQVASESLETSSKPEMSGLGLSHVPLAPCSVPQHFLDRLYDPGSPFRPKEGLYLGKTPIEPFKVPMGSYLLIIAKDAGTGSVRCPVSSVQELDVRDAGSKERTRDAGNAALNTPHSTLHADAEFRYSPVRVPVLVGRSTRHDLRVTLYREDEIPDGFVQVPAGPFIYQGDRGNDFAGPRQTGQAEDFFVARFPVTCEQYLNFLNDLAEQSPEEARARSPRLLPEDGFHWPRNADGTFRIPTGPGDGGSALEGTSQWWDPSWPVTAVSWIDLMHFARWQSKRLGRLLCLLPQAYWEKAARGVDGRFYPWGNQGDPIFCNMIVSFEGGPRPTPVDSFPTDESVYGARGMSGNSRDLCIGTYIDKYPGSRLFRGGDWSYAGHILRTTFRSYTSITGVTSVIGGRLMLMTRTAYPGAVNEGL